MEELEIGEKIKKVRKRAVLAALTLVAQTAMDFTPIMTLVMYIIPLAVMIMVIRIVLNLLKNVGD